MQRAMTASVHEAGEERSLTRGSRVSVGDGAVRLFVLGSGVVVVVTTALMLGFLAKTGLKGVAEAGLGSLLTGVLWKPEADLFGGVPLIVGTLVSAAGAVVTGAVPAVLAAVWLTEFAPKSLAAGYARIMQIAAALPSVVFGWMALTYLVPLLASLAEHLYGDDAGGGEGLAASGLLLGVMIAPTVLLLSLDALARVPKTLKEASAALGASPWQTAFRVVLPGAWRGLLVAVFFGFSRAAGETMAVQMVIGGARKLPSNLFTPTTTLSAQIVMDMQNARPNTPQSDVLFAMSLLLLVLSTGVVLSVRALSKRGTV